MIQLKPAGIEQISIIQAIARKTWPVTFGSMMPAAQIQYMLDLMYQDAALQSQIAERQHQFIVAENQNVPVGFTSFEQNYKNEATLMVHKLYLLPECQGTGIGTRIINHLTGIASQHNNEQLRLKVFYRNDKAIQFYEKNGFKQNGTEETNIGNGYIILDNVMLKLVS